MGSYATPPPVDEEADDPDSPPSRLGDLLAGRLSDVDIDSVEAVRDERARE